MFKKNKPTDIDKKRHEYVVDPEIQKQLAGRYANLFMICYHQSDISGMHIAFTALTHTIYALKLWVKRKSFAEQLCHYASLEGFPENEMYALEWLVNHYFELPNEHDESILLTWYQAIDDEWVLRKKLRKMFPEKSNSELTELIFSEKEKLH